MIRRAHVMGLLLASTALALLSWDLERPAMWLDESASVVATQRTWPQLWTLLNGADAPLVPYYALLKLVTTGLADLAPAMAGTPELLFRLPSVAAVVVAVWALTVWLGRQSVGLALCTAVSLLVTSGLSRYGQEARPYAFVLLLAVLATIAWDRLTTTDRGRLRLAVHVVLYALAVTLLVAAHLLAGSLVVAHLLASLVAPPPTSRRQPSPQLPTAEPRTSEAPATELSTAKSSTAKSGTGEPSTAAVRTGGSAEEPSTGTTSTGTASSETGPARPDSPDETSPASVRTGPGRLAALGRTVLGAGLGLAVVAPFAVSASGQGVGPTKAMPVTWDHLASAFLGLFTGNGAILGIGVSLLLAGLGTVQVVLSRHARIARIAVLWATVPPLVLLPLVMMRPNLVIGRYLMFVLPGWAVLSGLGVLTIAGLVSRPVARRPVIAGIAGGLTAAVLLGTMVATQVDPLVGVRTPGGHSEDIRPALAAANRPEYASLPIVMTSLYSSLEVSTYHRPAEARVLGQRVPRDRTSIWPVADAAADESWGEHERLVLLIREPSPSRCRDRNPSPTWVYVYRCMPKPFRSMRYRVETAEDAGHRWTFAVLIRRGERSDRS